MVVCTRVLTIKIAPPSAPDVARYLKHGLCIYSSDTPTHMCGEPKAVNHPHYCEAHVLEEREQDVRRALAFLGIVTVEEAFPSWMAENI